MFEWYKSHSITSFSMATSNLQTLCRSEAWHMSGVFRPRHSHRPSAQRYPTGGLFVTSVNNGEFTHDFWNFCENLLNINGRGQVMLVDTSTRNVLVFNLWSVLMLMNPGSFSGNPSKTHTKLLILLAFTWWRFRTISNYQLWNLWVDLVLIRRDFWSWGQLLLTANIWGPWRVIWLNFQQFHMGLSTTSC